MGFQIILSLLIVVAIIRLFVQFYKKHINFFFFFFFLTVWSMVLFLNWNNPLLNRLGSFLGIKRGATILVYIGLFLLFYFAFVSIIRFYELEQDVNKLVKKDAIDDFLKRYNINPKE